MKEIIFLSGTEEMTELFKNLKDRLENELGYNVYWYKGVFPQTENDPIKNCFDLIKKAHKFLLVIGKNYGTLYEKGISVVEKEFEIALEQVDLDILIFIRDEIYQQVSSYDIFKKIIKTEKELREICEENLGAKIDVYDFLLKVEKKDVWRDGFKSSREIIEKITQKWGEAEKIIEKRLVDIVFIPEKEVRFLDDLERELSLTVGKRNIFSSDNCTIEDCRFNNIGITLNRNNRINKLGIKEIDISTVPKRIINLKELSVLVLNDVKLDSIPQSIFTLPLDFLDLSCNQIYEIPQSINKLNYLDVLDLSNNKIKKVIKLDLKIQNLFLENNPLADNPSLRAIINIFIKSDHTDISFPMDKLKNAPIRNEKQIKSLIETHQELKKNVDSVIDKILNNEKEALRGGKLQEEQKQRILSAITKLTKKTEEPISQLIDFGYSGLRTLLKYYKTGDSEVKAKAEVFLDDMFHDVNFNWKGEFKEFIV